MDTYLRPLLAAIIAAEGAVVGSGGDRGGLAVATVERAACAWV